MNAMIAVLAMLWADDPKTNVAAWVEHTSREGGFVVSLPAEPREMDQTVGLSNGRTRVRGVIVNQGELIFAISYYDVPPIALAAQKTYLDGMRDNTVRQKNATLISEQKQTRDRMPERTLELERPSNEGGAEMVRERLRITLAGGRVYQALAACPASRRPDFDADITRFFDSFRIVKPTTEAATPPRDWVAFASPEGKFSVSLPAEPRAVKYPVRTADGPKEVVVHQVTGEDVVYMVSHTEAEPEDAETPAKTLDKVRDLAVSISKGKLLSDKRIALGRWQGREFRAEVPLAGESRGGLLKGRIYLVGKRVYQLMAVEPKSRVAAHSKQIDAFFSSFKSDAQ